MRLAIVGSRDYPSREEVESYVATLPLDTVVISGGARGVDTWAVDAAQARGLQVEVYPADWKAHGKAAGFIRNGTIVEKAERVKAFWDGKSRGTLHTMMLARAAGKLEE